jgi:hypothetical protein
MTVYGQSLYGQSLYGYTIPPQYRADPFIASPIDYETISVTWTKPAGTILAWRLIKNMYGLPTDQDDGEILLDVTSGYPGNSFADTTVTPGAYHYYGFYVLINSSTDTWVRASTTGCLMPANYSSAQMMLDLIPNFYKDATDLSSQLQVDDTGNTFLDLFIQVFGWGTDYLRTQYDTYLNINNPWKIPLNDLYSLATQVGININPDIHPYTLRKAVYFNAAINQQRGTVSGIAAELSALTGWFSDITQGQNLMLENDQSYFDNPNYQQWSGNITYNINERVTYGNYYYQCISSANYGHAPTGTTSSNTWWQAVLGTADNTDLANHATGGISTWELLYPGVSNGGPSVGTLTEVIGIADPLNAANLQFNGLKATNANGSTSDMYLRSVSRTTADKTVVTTTFAPDKYQAIAEGIPVPYISFAQPWNSATMYDPQDVVLYNNQPFISLRSSLDSVPPYTNTGTASQDWAPLGFDQRFRICASAYVNSQSGVAVTPFVEWYDAGGNYITRVIARTPGTTVGLPNNLAFDSFVTGIGSSLTTSRTTDDGQWTWTSKTGSFTVSPFSGGCVYPTVESTKSISTINTGSANIQVGLTFITQPNSGWSTGICLRYANNTSYIRADMTELRQNNGGTITVLGTYSTPCSVGDRLIVTLNGNTITCFRNGIQVLQVTSSFNSGVTFFGIISEPGI